MYNIQDIPIKTTDINPCSVTSSWWSCCTPSAPWTPCSAAWAPCTAIWLASLIVGSS